MKPEQRLKEIYLASRETQKSFADNIGMSPSGFATLIAGKSNVSRVLANSVELKYGYCAEWILTGNEPKYSSIQKLKEEEFNQIFDGAIKELKKLKQRIMNTCNG